MLSEVEHGRVGGSDGRQPGHVLARDTDRARWRHGGGAVLPSPATHRVRVQRWRRENQCVRHHSKAGQCKTQTLQNENEKTRESARQTFFASLLPAVLRVGRGARCWARAPADHQVGDHFRARAADPFTLHGPNNSVAQLCVLGRHCNLTLAGAGFAATNRLRVNGDLINALI